MEQHNDSRDLRGDIIDMQVIEGLRELGGEDEPGLLIEIVALFLADAPQRLGEIDRALATGDLRSLERAAHTLKSSSQNVGALGLARMCREMEELARKQELAPVRGVYEASRGHWSDVERALRSID
jgi:HPt (histidine-containing phosphotransfer) domain-containing protein